jgi:hypothetical protein
MATARLLFLFIRSMPSKEYKENGFFFVHGNAYIITDFLTTVLEEPKFIVEKSKTRAIWRRKTIGPLGRDGSQLPPNKDSNFVGNWVYCLVWVLGFD